VHCCFDSNKIVTLGTAGNVVPPESVIQNKDRVKCRQIGQGQTGDDHWLLAGPGMTGRPGLVGTVSLSRLTCLPHTQTRLRLSTASPSTPGGVAYTALSKQAAFLALPTNLRPLLCVVLHFYWNCQICLGLRIWDTTDSSHLCGPQVSCRHTSSVSACSLNLAVGCLVAVEGLLPSGISEQLPHFTTSPETGLCYFTAFAFLLRHCCCSCSGMSASL
jgi:hypothetical protein